MADNEFDSPLDGDVYINLVNELSLTELASSLAADPVALAIIVAAVRLELTKEARGIGNLFGTWAQKQPPPTVIQPNVKRRLT